MALPFEGAVGVFDSGVGGLTVVDAILRRTPNEKVLYVADQAHVPYGGRPLEEVREFATSISRFLAAQGCRAVVMACNISSAVALPSVERLLAPLPIIGVIDPASRVAAKHNAGLDADGEPPIIGVLATEGTVNSGAYPKVLGSYDPRVTVAQVPCPRFVPLVEAGRTESADAVDAAREYLTFLARLHCRTIILGCTHYPYLLPALRRVAGELFEQPVTFIDPAQEAAESLSGIVEDAGSMPGRSLLLTTGNPDNFQCQAPTFLASVGREAYDTGAAAWRDGTLQITDH